MLYLCCLVSSSMAQDNNFFFHHITSDDNLAGQYFSAAFKDSKGLVWIGSSNAVNVFDGTAIKSYKADTTQGLNGSTYFYYFLEDEDANIWLSGSGGFHLFERSTSTFHQFDLKGNTYHLLAIDSSNHLWLTSKVGSLLSIHRFNLNTRDTTNTLVGYVDNCQRNNVVLDETGKVVKIISTYLDKSVEMGKGIKIYDVNYNSPNISLTQGRLELEEYSTRNSIVENDTLWIGSVNRLLAYNLTNAQYESFPFRGRSITFWDVEVWDDTRLIVSSDKGLFVFDKKEKKFVQEINSNINNKGSLLDNDVRQIYKDTNNILWISQWLHGVSYLDLDKHQFSQVDELMGKDILHLMEDNAEKIWVSTKDGVFIFDKKGNLLQGPIITKLQEDSRSFESFFLYKNELWAISGKLIFKWTGNKFEYSHEDRNYEAFFLDDEKNLLGYEVGTGIFKINLENQTSPPWDNLGEINAKDLNDFYSFDFGKIFSTIKKANLFKYLPKKVS